MLFKLVHFSRSYMMRKQATSHNLCTYKNITQVGTSHGFYAYLVGDGEDLPWPAEGEAGDSTSSSLMGSIRVVLRRAGGVVARGGATHTGVGAKVGVVRAGVGAMTWLNSSVEGRRRVGVKDADDETKFGGGAMGRSSLLLAAQP